MPGCAGWRSTSPPRLDDVGGANAGLSPASRHDGRRAVPDPTDADTDIWQVVRTLPRRQATALVLYYLADESVTSVAEAMGCAEGTAKAHLHQGRAALARLLGDPTRGRTRPLRRPPSSRDDPPQRTSRPPTSQPTHPPPPLRRDGGHAMSAPETDPQLTDDRLRRAATDLRRQVAFGGRLGRRPGAGHLRRRRRVLRRGPWLAAAAAAVALVVAGALVVVARDDAPEEVTVDRRPVRAERERPRRPSPPRWADRPTARPRSTSP